MLTQGIKRWLQGLFAWWPWRRGVESDYAQTSSHSNRGTSQEAMFRTVIDGPLTQPAQQNTITISIEPPGDEAFDDLSPSEHKDSSNDTSPLTPPTTQQRLEFLRYLVQRGIVSDDI